MKLGTLPGGVADATVPAPLEAPPAVWTPLELLGPVRLFAVPAPAPEPAAEGIVPEIEVSETS